LGLSTFVVISRYISSAERIGRVLLTIMIACVCISILGIIERFFPEVAALFPWFFTQTEVTLVTGFGRTMYSFWGTPGAAIVLTWGAAISAWLVVYRPRTITTKFAVAGVLCLPIILTGIYISGSRINWFAVVVCVLVLAMLTPRRLVYAPVIVLVGILLLQSLPEDATERLESFSQTTNLGGTDTLALGGRTILWTQYVNYFVADPLGGRGDFRGAAHNSFLDLAGTLGVLPAGSFALFWLLLNRRIVVFFLRSKPEHKAYAAVFLCFLITWNIQVMTGTVFHNPIYGAPHWVLIAIGWYLPDILGAE
jgi:hypothetical protein